MKWPIGYDKYKRGKWDSAKSGDAWESVSCGSHGDWGVQFRSGSRDIWKGGELERKTEEKQRRVKGPLSHEVSKARKKITFTHYKVAFCDPHLYSVVNVIGLIAAFLVGCITLTKIALPFHGWRRIVIWLHRIGGTESREG